MTSKGFNLVACFVMIFVSLACSQDPDLKVARQFLDQYYVMANHEQAMAISQGQASESLQKEKDLLRGVSMQQEVDAYRTRDITFKLEKEQKTNEEAVFLYRLKILIPGLNDQEKLVNITVDRKSGKIQSFGTL